MRARVLLITPAFNEARHIALVARAVAAQTRPPDCWMVVDHGSTDDTIDQLRKLEPSLPFLRIVAAPPATDHGQDRLAVGAPVRAFNVGLRAAASAQWEYVGKLDGDMELPAVYVERLLERFSENPCLGIAGGRYVEDTGNGRWRTVAIPPHNVPGALKLYRVTCLAAIGGLPEVLGWDTIDEVYARMRGFSTRSYDDLVAVHHRRTGAAAGVLRGRARHGVCAWVVHYPGYFVALRAVKLAARRPVGVSGAAFLWGYARAALSGVPRVPDDAFRTHMRTELRARVRAGARSVAKGPRQAMQPEGSI